MTYFILGSHPKLSIAELKAVLGGEYHPLFVSDTVVVTEPIDRNLGELQERLAGIIKVGRIMGELKNGDLPQAQMADLIANVASQAVGKNKINFGLSVYELGNRKVAGSLEYALHRLGLEVKQRLKETGRPVRYVKGKEPRLSSVIVQTNHLLESGGEFVILTTPLSILIGQTEAVQNFKAWSDRDYGRPARNARSGMLPPKLARLMINLSGVDPRGTTLLDPFCGSGTVLMEATLMGFQKLIGSDISQKAIKDTTTNIKWLVKQFGLAMPAVSLHVAPAAELATIEQIPVDLLVTEVFLGNPRRKTVNVPEAQKLKEELLPVFKTSFSSLATLLKPSSRAVVAFPAFKTKDGDWHRLPLQSLLEQIGYRILDYHLYSRPDQFVARDIYVFTRK